MPGKELISHINVVVNSAWFSKRMKTANGRKVLSARREKDAKTQFLTKEKRIAPNPPKGRKFIINIASFLLGLFYFTNLCNQ
jgi:hypothetical protein